MKAWEGPLDQYDVVIIGAGIAGASAGYFLSRTHRVVLVEREEQPGYHSTGRSAALFAETYGNRSIRVLTAGSRRFFETPPAGFTEAPLLTPRGQLLVGRADQMEALDRHVADVAPLARDIRRVDGAAAAALCPVLRKDYVAGAVLDPNCMDIDVAGLHHGFLRGIRANGGRIATDAEVRRLERPSSGNWLARTRTDSFSAPVLVDAAGAWADEIAVMAGIDPIGLVPMRRTAMLIDLPKELYRADWPMVVDVDEELYFKPDAGKLLLSPDDETVTAACDAQPEDLDVAICIDRLEKMTTLTVRRVTRKWAGLRTFAPDRSLVAGFEPGGSGFFWLAGQGGYGIQTSPAMGRIAARLICGKHLPDDFAAHGVSADDLSVRRLRRNQALQAEP